MVHDRAVEHAEGLPTVVFVRLHDEDVGAHLRGDAGELARRGPDGGMHEDPCSRVVFERVRETVKDVLRAHDVVSGARVLRVAWTDDAQKGRFGRDNVHHMNLRFVDRPDESAGLRQQVLSDTAHVDPDDDDDTAGLLDWLDLGMRVHTRLPFMATCGPSAFQGVLDVLV